MVFPKGIKNAGIYLATFSMGLFVLLKAAQPSSEFKEELKERNARRQRLETESERVNERVCG